MSDDVRIVPGGGLIPRGRHLTIDGAPDAFVRSMGRGARPPVLLLHGLGATGALNWAPVFEPLAREHRVIAVDHRGHGRGPRVGSDFSLADCAEDAAAVLRRLNDQPAIVVGYSMGGPIAQLLARRHPELVEGLVLSATARDFRGRPTDQLRFAIAGAVAAATNLGPSVVIPPVPVLPGPLHHLGWVASELRRHEPAALMAAAAELGRFTSRDWVGSLEVPAAVIVHARDRLVPVSRQRRLAEELPGAIPIEVDLAHVSVRGRDAYIGALVEAISHVEHPERPELHAA